jgi:hypothetical protein
MNDCVTGREATKDTYLQLQGREGCGRNGQVPASPRTAIMPVMIKSVTSVICRCTLPFWNALFLLFTRHHQKTVFLMRVFFRVALSDSAGGRTNLPIYRIMPPSSG